MKEIIYLFVTLVMFIANCILCKSAKYETVEYKEEGEVKLKHEDGSPVLTAAIFININEQDS